MPLVRRFLTLLTTAALVAALCLCADRPEPDPLVTPAASGSSYLCTGYVGCAKAGYSSSGYNTANKKMYWRMYAGHNCTNYAAYRMIQSGYSATRPWSSGSGSAFNWGVAMKKITNTTPAVGAVAWWPANAPGAGSSGHVAYVEKVVSSTEIIISEDMWGGDFHWRDIKAGSRWPKGFIHFNDVGLTNTAPPVITGTPQVGTPLAASTGSWTNSPTAYAYQWLADGAAIPGATAATFTPTADQLTARLAVQVTASKAKFAPATATSAATAPVATGQLVGKGAVTITGTPSLGETLTARPNTWSPAPTTQTFQWYADGKPIAGAVKPTLVLGTAQIGTRLTTGIRVKRSGYADATATSSAVGPVRAGQIAINNPFRLSGPNRLGQTVRVVPGTVTPAQAAVGYQWLRNGKPIPGATGDAHRMEAADLGRMLSVRVTLTSPHYLPSSVVLTSPTVTKVNPKLGYRAVGSVHRAVVSLSVAATGTVPRGTVRVKVGKHWATGTLVKGRYTATITRLAAGPHKVSIYYLGTDPVAAAKLYGKVRVPKR